MKRKTGKKRTTTKKLPAGAIAGRMATMPGWKLKRDAIIREFEFASFPDAIAFVTKLAFAAEAADHHPDIDVRYKRVRIAWTTHDAGGVTEKDFAGAEQSDTIARAFGPA